MGLQVGMAVPLVVQQVRLLQAVVLLHPPEHQALHHHPEPQAAIHLAAVQLLQTHLPHQLLQRAGHQTLPVQAVLLIQALPRGQAIQVLPLEQVIRVLRLGRQEQQVQTEAGHQPLLVQRPRLVQAVLRMLDQETQDRETREHPVSTRSATENWDIKWNLGRAFGRATGLEIRDGVRFGLE